MSATYYWEHWTDETKYHRYASAADAADLSHLGEVGVIVKNRDGHLQVEAVSPRRTKKETAAALVAARRAMESRGGEA
jgi:Cu/Zn superoxide dismutase